MKFPGFSNSMYFGVAVNDIEVIFDILETLKSSGKRNSRLILIQRPGVKFNTSQLWPFSIQTSSQELCICYPVTWICFIPGPWEVTCAVTLGHGLTIPVRAISFHRFFWEIVPFLKDQRKSFLGSNLHTRPTIVG